VIAAKVLKVRAAQAPCGRLKEHKHMDVDTNNIEVEHNSAAQRYEARIDRYLAVADYYRSGDTITFTHTEVPPALRGRGIASKLIHSALEDARAQNLTVVPLCSFVATYIRRHTQYAPLLRSR
jgi:predicted GNAT family acetyltransferase